MALLPAPSYHPGVRCWESGVWGREVSKEAAGFGTGRQCPLTQTRVWFLAFRPRALVARLVGTWPVYICTYISVTYLMTVSSWLST